MATLIGRVGMVIKGDWDSSVAYDTLDVVTYNNNTYIAKQASPAGTLPTNTTYWQLSLDASLLANKVSGATSGNFAGLDSNGNLTDSGHKHSDYLTQHQDISGKADKVSGATEGNLAGLDVNGNITDSGIAAGNTSISSIGDGTLTGAVSAENGAIDAIVNVYGGKNLLPYPYDHTTKTESDITFTDNKDGSVTVSGTASSNAVFYFKYGSLLLDVGEYIINGCPSGGSEQTYYISTTWGVDTGNGLRFTLQQPTNSGTLLIIIKSGTVISTPITFYPMLRDARISDPTYAPYTMTNRELTERVKNISVPNGEYEWCQYWGAVTTASGSNTVGSTFQLDLRGKNVSLVYAGYFDSGATLVDITATSTAGKYNDFFQIISTTSTDAANKFGRFRIKISDQT